MGTNCCLQLKSKNGLNENGEYLVDKFSFNKKYPIGKGGFGRVNKK